MKLRLSKIDWLNLGMEFIVVIIGILLAFQLNNYSQEKQHHRTIQNHLDLLREESIQNQSALESAIAQTQTHVVRLDSILRMIDQKESLERVNALGLELLNMGGVYFRKNAYQTLLQTGDIRLMKNFRQKQNIVNLYEYYKWVESFNEISNNLYMSDYYPYLKENFDLLEGLVQDEEVYRSKLFRNILAAYKRTSENRLEKYRDCLAELKSYLDQTN